MRRAVFRYLERLVVHDGAFRALARLRVAVFRRLLPVAPDGLQATRRGDVLTTLVRDAGRLQDRPLRVVQPLVSGLVVAGLAVIGVAWLSPIAATVLGLDLIVTLRVATGLVTALGRDAERRIAPLRADLVDGVLDHLARVDVLRAYGADTAARVAINELDAQLRRAQTRQSAAAGAVASVFTLAGGAPLIVSALTVIDRVVLPLALAARCRARASAERIDTVVPDQRPPGIPVPPATAGPAPAADATIVLRGVTARWPGAATAALTPAILSCARVIACSSPGWAGRARRRSRTCSCGSSTRMMRSPWAESTCEACTPTRCASASFCVSSSRTSSTSRRRTSIPTEPTPCWRSCSAPPHPLTGPCS